MKKRGRGRPPIRGPKRTRRLMVRLRPGEFFLIRRAKGALLVSEWARGVLLEAAARALATPTAASDESARMPGHLARRKGGRRMGNLTTTAGSRARGEGG